MRRDFQKILLSGGMDSAILALYFPGCDAYTLRFLGGDDQKEELGRNICRILWIFAVIFSICYKFKGCIA